MSQPPDCCNRLKDHLMSDDTLYPTVFGDFGNPKSGILKVWQAGLLKILSRSGWFSLTSTNSRGKESGWYYFPFSTTHPISAPIVTFRFEAHNNICLFPRDTSRRFHQLRLYPHNSRTVRISCTFPGLKDPKRWLGSIFKVPPSHLFSFHKAASKAGLPAILAAMVSKSGSTRSTGANKKALKSEIKDVSFLSALSRFLLEKVISVSPISSQNGNASCQSSSAGGFCGHPIGPFWWWKSNEASLNRGSTSDFILFQWYSSTAFVSNSNCWRWASISKIVIGS